MFLPDAPAWTAGCQVTERLYVYAHNRSKKIPVAQTGLLKTSQNRFSKIYEMTLVGKPPPPNKSSNHKA